MATQQQISLFPSDNALTKESSSTFINNMSLAIHRWFRYSAGFSAEWVRQVIRERTKQGCRHILDPFAGAGTVLLEADLAGVRSIGLEAHPFVYRVARAKLNWGVDTNSFRRFADDLLRKAQKKSGNNHVYPPLIEKCFSSDTLKKLDALKTALISRSDQTPEAELAWLALVSILRECSPVGTAQWQYILPKKKKAATTEPFLAFQKKVQVMINDLNFLQSRRRSSVAKIFSQDARTCDKISSNWADLVITSPPYANNYDYADATRFELSFMGEINSWGDLQTKIRPYLIRSCTQHVAPLSDTTFDVVNEPRLDCIRSSLQRKCEELRDVRESHGGKKPYHTMIAYYFSDMAHVWKSLRRVVKKNGMVCFVIGDSAPYGVHIPVDEWLGQLAIANGFSSFHFEKTRDRNTKWRNRKHTVPLKEGHLWVSA